MNEMPKRNMMSNWGETYLTVQTTLHRPHTPATAAAAHS
jgi:hypothetical protein